MNRHLGDYFDLLAPMGPRIFVLTNAMLLKDEMIERFVKGGLAYLNFSVDGARAGTYNRIRRGANFDTVMANISKVVAKRRELGAAAPYLRMVFVACAPTWRSSRTSWTWRRTWAWTRPRWCT